MRSKCFAHTYFKAWLSVFFPNWGTAKMKLPSTEILNKRDKHDRGVEENDTETGKGRGKIEKPESMLWLQKKSFLKRNRHK